MAEPRDHHRQCDGILLKKICAITALPTVNLNQVSLPAFDVERSASFYRAMGFRQIVAAPPHYARFECQQGEATFSIHQVEQAAPDAGFVVYFECEDVDAEVARLQDDGIIFDRLPTDERWLWREARLRDPHGHVICLYHAGDSRKNPPWRLPG